MLLVNNTFVHVLFDSRTNKSFVSLIFMPHLEGKTIDIESPYVVEIANGHEVKVGHVLKNYAIEISGQRIPLELLPMKIDGFDIVFGMDWLTTNKAWINCKNKTLEVQLPDGLKAKIKGDLPQRMKPMISMARAEKYLKKGYKSFLLYAMAAKEEKKIEDVPVVADFIDVFPEDLPGLPPARQVEFQIELLPGTAPIASAPYRLAPLEMQELMKQLQELLERGLI
jgi:hypothetical protein